MRLKSLYLLPIAAITLLWVSGCTTESGPDPAVIANHQSRLVLAEEPADATTVLDLREQEGGFTEGEVVLVGRIGGLPNPWKESEPEFPWKKDEATLFLVDPATAAEFADHATEDDDHHENCPFCARAAENATGSIAAVTFTDEQGQPIAVGAKQLFDVNENDLVVIRGKSKMLPGDLVMVMADGIYVRE